MACHRTNGGRLNRLTALEHHLQPQKLQSGFELAPQDTAFFEYMFARALSGDRDWAPADQARYHSILLGETDQ